MRNDLKNTIFLSYRRKDTASAAGRLHDYLEREFGADMVFKDIHDIGLGTDFRKAIGKTLMDCKVVLVLIGDRYVSLTDAEGNIRIMNPNDYVNIEVSTALAFKDQKLVIPILINGARMPKRDQIPESMEALTWQNSKKLSNDYWKTDIERLIKAIREYLHLPKEKEKVDHTTNGPRRKPTPPPKKSSNSGIFKGIALAIGLFMLLIGIGVAFNPEDSKNSVTPAYNNIFTSFTGYVDATKLNVRSEPGTSGTDIITQLEQGDKVTVTNEKDYDGKSWYQINVNGHEGWVSGSFISSSVVDQPSQKDPIYSSKKEPSVHHATKHQPISPPPIVEEQPVTYTYQELAMGSWNLQRLSYNGEQLTLEDFMTVLTDGAMFIQSAKLSYYMNGVTNTIASEINGTPLETVVYNYHINGNTFTMSNGTVANIDLLTQREMNITLNSFDGFNNGRLTFYFTKI